MKEKMHITVLSLGVCALVSMTFAVSMRDYKEKEKAPRLNSASVSSTTSKNFVCSAESISESSQATKEYNKNIRKIEELLSKVDSLGGNTHTLEDICEGLKGREKTECNINNVELKGVLRQIKKLEENMIPYEECVEKLGLLETDKKISGEVDTEKQNKKKEETRTTNLPGDNNDIVWTAKDPNVRIKYLAPAGITTNVAVEGKNVIITPGIKTNMLVSGSLTPKSPTNPARLLMYAGKDGGGHIWTHNGEMMSFSGLKSGEASMSYNGQNWTYASHSGAGNFADYVAQKIAKTTTPDGLKDWTVYVGSGQPTVTALASNASQIIAAVATNPVASKLLSGKLAPGNDGTGSIGAMDMLTFCTSDSRSSTCTDSDEGGKTKKKEGITTKEKKMNTISNWSEGEWSACSNGKKTRKVECQSEGKKVIDSKCEGKKPVTNQECQSENLSSIKYKCKDSDGGRDYFKKGKSDGLWYGYDSQLETHTDVCLSGKLYEYYCNNGSLEVEPEVTCPNGCKDGACINTDSLPETQIESQYTLTDTVNKLQKVGLISDYSINRVNDKMLFQDYIDLIIRVMGIVSGDFVRDYKCKNIFSDISEPRICKTAEIALENGIIKKQFNKAGEVVYNGERYISINDALYYTMLSQCINTKVLAKDKISILKTAKNLGITNTDSIVDLESIATKGDVYISLVTFMNSANIINSSYFDASIANCANKISGS